MADEYDPLDPPTYNAADDDDDGGYDEAVAKGSDDQDDAADEDDDYDPSSFAFGSSNEQSSSVPLVPAQTQVESVPKPKQKVAGFIVEESDDEEEDSAAPSAPFTGLAESQVKSAQDTVAEEQDVLLHSAPQDIATASKSVNGSATVSVPPSSLPTTSSQVPVSAARNEIPLPAKPAVPPSKPELNKSSATPAIAAQPNGQTQARLPHDKVGQLEDRIKDDPKGDTEAWLTLIQHYYEKGQHDFVREVYARFFKVFPSAVSMWIRYVSMENELDERNRVVVILNEALLQVPSVDLWKLYLDHVRRALPLINDADGQNRGQITQAFEMTMANVGIDPDSGLLWREYIDFLKESPGTVGGSSWQDLQKVDVLRKAYQRAIKLPHSEFVRLWKEYETFEMSLHKTIGRKHVQEQSPHYMQCRTAKMQLDQRLAGLDRTSLPRLPPIYGCAGDDEFGTQVEKYQAWIAWEKDEDPLVYKGTEDEAYQKRVIYAFTQATMSLAFYPPIWYDAATWCFAQGSEALSTQGEQFLEKGIAANPESVLLALMKAERIESSLEIGSTDEIMIRNGEKLDNPFENVHTALYDLRNKLQKKDKESIAQIQQRFASIPEEDDQPAIEDEDEDRGLQAEKPQTREERLQIEVDAVKNASAARLESLKRTISYVWIAKMRAFRRVQGQGKPQKKGELSKGVVKGFRGIFSDARPRGPLSSDVYIASALMEWNCYRDPSALKIFERGMKLFPTDESFILAYIKHLVAENDTTNARVVLEGTLQKITNSTDFTQDQKRYKCRPLFAFMHDYESKYGDLAQIQKLERRMTELYPDEPSISRFSQRFSLEGFDAIDEQLVISPSQTLPKPIQPQLEIAQPPVASIESAAGTPRIQPEILLGPNGPYVASPKRPLDDSDNEMPRKFIRGDSPLKGAAGIRIQSKAAANLAANAGMAASFAPKNFTPNTFHLPAGPPPLPPQIEAILRILPNAASYTAVRLDPAKLTSFMSNVNVDRPRPLYNAGAGQPFQRL